MLCEHYKNFESGRSAAMMCDSINQHCAENIGGVRVNMGFKDMAVQKVAVVFGKHQAKSYKTIGCMYSRLYRYLFGGCGTNLIIAGKPKIFRPKNIVVGNYVRINDGVQLSPQEAHIKICDYCTFSRGSQVVAGSLDTSKWIDCGYKDHVHIYKDVYIGEGTWLGINAIILPGVKITGKGVIIAAGAVVTHDITEDYVLVAGAPGRIVKRLS